MANRDGATAVGAGAAASGLGATGADPECAQSAFFAMFLQH